VLLAALLAFGPRVAAAQGAAPPPAEAAVVPPRPLAPLQADYPEGAAGDALVVLVVTVNADGSVRSARVAEGPEPFGAAAVAASSGWRFEPATRDGKAFAAAIRAQIRFTAPAPPPPPPPPPAAPINVGPRPPGAPIPPPAPSPPPPLEVTVRGEVPAPGVTSMTRAEVRLLPGAFGDPFRAVETLPGVTPLASGLPFFYVRGAPPGNVGYFLDGIRVPLLYHIGLGPSVVNPAIVERVDLYPGGYPAAFGRYAGGIVAGETRELVSEWHGEANVRVVDAGLMLQGPIGDQGAFMVAGRYSYTGALLSLISSSIELGYWDYQARASYRVTPRDEVAIFAFGAHDHLGNKDDRGQSQTLFDTTFHRVDLRYDHRFGGPEDRVRQAITLGYDETAFDKGAFVRDKLLTSRTQVTRRLSPEVLVRAGLDGQLDGYEANLKPAFGDSPGFTSLFANRIDVVMGARADAVIAVTPRLEVTPGIRVDFFESFRPGLPGLTAFAVDPRLSSRLAVTRDVRIVQAYGLASQPPSFVLPGPGFQMSLAGGLQRSFQASAGVEADLPGDVVASGTFFRNAFFNLNDALGTTAAPSANGQGFTDDFNRRALGSSVGFELMVRRRLTRRLGGLLSYTISRSVRSQGNATVASSFDRTHVLNVAATYDIGKGFKAGARVLFYTGYPILVPNPTPPYDLRQTGRLPPFGRLDVRLEKRWAIMKKGWISLVLEVLNATATKETLGESCALLTCKPSLLGPITIPSLGLEGGF
jgi:TonB family protein